MDRKEASKILGVSENATQEEIKKAYKKLSLKEHPDKVLKCTKTTEKKPYVNCGNKKDDGEMWFCSDQHKSKYQLATEKFQKISDAYGLLTNDGPEQPDNSNIDEDAIWLMKQKIKNAFDYNNVKMEEIEDEVIKNYEEKLRKCKTKEDLERFTSEVVFFIQLFARARDKGYFKNTSSGSTPPP